LPPYVLRMAHQCRHADDQMRFNNQASHRYVNTPATGVYTWPTQPTQDNLATLRQSVEDPLTSATLMLRVTSLYRVWMLLRAALRNSRPTS
jgi:hypothetical protein